MTERGHETADARVGNPLRLPDDHIVMYRRAKSHGIISMNPDGSLVSVDCRRMEGLWGSQPGSPLASPIETGRRVRGAVLADAPTPDGPPRDQRITVVVPAYRAAQSIAGVIGSIPPFVADIIVVDDGSPDDTSMHAAAAGDPRVHIIRHGINQGVGGATWTGFTAAIVRGAEIVVKMDADGQMDPAYLPRLLAPVITGTADYAKGNRFLHRRQLGAMPLLRRIGNTGLSFLTKAASGYWTIFDPSNGYLTIRAHVLGHLDPTRIDKRYFFETSMLLELRLAGAVVVDVDIPARYGDEVSGLCEWSSLRTFPGRLLTALVRRLYILHFAPGLGAVALFLIAGSVLSAVGAALVAFAWSQSTQVVSAHSAETAAIATVSLILGARCLLQSALLDAQSQPAAPLGSLAVRLPQAARGTAGGLRDEPGKVARELSAIVEGLHEQTTGVSECRG